MFSKNKSKALSCCILRFKGIKQLSSKKKYKLMQSAVDCIISEQYSCPTTENTAVNYIGWANLSSVNMTTHNLKGRTRVSKWLRRIVPSVTLGKWAGRFLLLRQPDGQKSMGDRSRSVGCVLEPVCEYLEWVSNVLDNTGKEDRAAQSGRRLLLLARRLRAVTPSAAAGLRKLEW